MPPIMSAEKREAKGRAIRQCWLSPLITGWHSTSMFRPDCIRQLKQLLLGGLGRRERAIVLELHRACMRDRPSIGEHQMSKHQCYDRDEEQ
jgi:hypothetical protein